MRADQRKSPAIELCIYTALFALLFFVCLELGYQVIQLLQKPKPFPPPIVLDLRGVPRDIDRNIFAYDNCAEWNKGRKKPLEKNCDIKVERVEF